MRVHRRVELGVFLILLASYAFFWHSRDWNSASRLMLTYALVDRQTIALDGLNDQTGDIAYFRGRYYTDKLPGYSFLATAPYAFFKAVLGLPSHPLRQRGFPYWPADYWVTLGTSGLLSALAAVLLVGLARDLGCTPRRAALVGLAYALATPAYVYATMSYGHQAAAFALIASFALLWRNAPDRANLRAGAAGFLAAYASVIELQVGPVSAILGLYLVAQAVGRHRPFSTVGAFAVGALVPTLLLLGYNQLAFGWPFDMGYFHEVQQIFRDVHREGNPLGLGRPMLGRTSALLFGRFRGLLFYAPIAVLAVPGWVVLYGRRLWGMATVSLLVVLAVFAVNLSYPNWTGGWSTGPRLLVPLLPFAMLPMAAILAQDGRWAPRIAVGLALSGAILMFLFQGVGARVPDAVADPLRDYVLPHWRGAPLARWEIDARFTRNLTMLAVPERAMRSVPERWLWVQFVPLALFQIVAVGALFRLAGRGEDAREGTSPAGRQT